MASNQSRILFDAETYSPAMPETVEETGLDFGFLADLALKAAYADTNCTSERVADKLKLPMGVAETVLQHLYHERLIEIRERTQFQSNRYGMLDRGWERAQKLLGISGYIGAAPVPLDSYFAGVLWMEKVRRPLNPESVTRAFADMVLHERVFQTLGLVADSRRSLFLTGPPGCGKTTAALALHDALEGEVWVPYAVEVDGQVIRVFDAHNHEPVAAPSTRHDRRWVKIKRPLVVVGGEMTIESMDLIYSSSVRFYEAPFQMKSNGGVLLIDDFGRQRIDPHDLLNRWIIPLENRIDYLTLHTGKKIQVPFEQLLVFATNLNPKDLVDEAFLRRMGYRLAFSTPTTETYEQILRRYVSKKELHYRPEFLDLLMTRYQREQREMKACEPRDLVERSLDIMRYENLPRELNTHLLERAWRNYFGT